MAARRHDVAVNPVYGHVPLTPLSGVGGGAREPGVDGRRGCRDLRDDRVPDRLADPMAAAAQRAALGKVHEHHHAHGVRRVDSGFTAEPFAAALVIPEPGVTDCSALPSESDAVSRDDACGAAAV